jgi:hypothetical protein
LKYRYFAGPQPSLIFLCFLSDADQVPKVRRSILGVQKYRIELGGYVHKIKTKGIKMTSLPKMLKL